jgi:RNA polymerase-binding transcription factor DksA
MTLLANRAGASASDKDTHEHNKENTAAVRKPAPAAKPAAREATPAVNPPVDALRTLQTRLQAQLNPDNGHEDGGAPDPETRFLAQSVRRRLNQVNAALQRIEEGKYGECADCKESIESDRLILQPMSTRCTRCQAIAEWRGTAY